MKISKSKQQDLDKAYDTFIQVCLFDMPLRELEPYIPDDVMNFGAGVTELTIDKEAFLKQIENQKAIASGLEMDFQISPVMRKITNEGKGAIYTDDIINTVWVNKVKNELKFRLSSIFEYVNGKWIMIHSHTSAPDSQRNEDEVWPVEDLKRRTEFLEKSLEEKVAELEVKNRELEIETALERVRAKAMAMHNSDELDEVLAVLCRQFDELGILPMSTHMTVFDFDNDQFTFRETGKFGNRSFGEQTVALDAMDTWKETIEQWRASEALSINRLYFPKETLPEVWEVFHESFASMPEGSRITPDDYPDGIYHTAGKHPFGYIGMNQIRKATEEEEQIVVKFANEFGRAYQRFLDLKKAEAQAREAQIEAALEKVRSRSIGMQNSEELREVIQVIHDQFIDLNFEIDAAGFTLDYHQNNDWNTWIANKSESLPSLMFIPYIDHPQFNYYKSAKEKGLDFLANTLSFEDKNSIFNYMFGFMGDYPQAEKDEVLSKPGLAISQAFLKNISLWIYNLDAIPYSEEVNSILMRFAKVFEQTYTRFLDLQKAEAQAREAQIEAALEKVRSRTMAMHKSSELLNVINILSQEIKQLGIQFNHVSFGVNDDLEDFHFWTSIADGREPIKIHVPAMDSPIHQNIRNAQKDGVDFFTDHLSAKVNDSWIAHLTKHTENPFLSKEELEYIKGKEINRSVVLLPNIFLVLAKYSSVPLSEEENQILKRIAGVFEQAYIRFLDLQKAEAQAKEAQIEAALEKVRSRTMSMHKTDELEDVVILVVEKLMELGVVLDANGVVLCTYFPGSKDVLHWMSSPDFTFSGSYLLPYFDHPIFKAAWESRLSGDEYFSKSFSVEEKNTFWAYAFENSDYKHMPEEFKEWVFQNDKHSLSFAWSENAAILIPSHTGVVPNEEEVEILKRFAKVFEGAYVRFMDLQKTELAARETQIELSLEKIRALVTSMQESSELLDIVVAMRKEFVSLGHEAHYFWYMRWLPEIYEKAMTSGDGTKIGSVLSLPRKIHGELKNIAEWEKGTDPTVIHVMNPEEAIDYVHKMIEWGDFLQIDQNVPTDDDIRHIGGLTYVMARTSQGEIGYSLPGMVPDPPKEAVETLVRYAGVFDLAYRRFEDLKEAEQQSQQLLEEKNRLEYALSELKAAQTQLIHAEKMASLGELTAGIAHEIQNPLNFVNNFSEVSSELIEEAKDEMEAGEYEEVMAIIEDLMQNLQKIHHHGERASSIVNGMLDHSRADTGEKVKADINQLADECLRLSYHGMRAKDRDFQAGFDIHLDPDLPKLEIVSQDISRVLLNLINNAFYAVSDETLVKSDSDYKPKVSVMTKNLGDQIEITVSDNGPGIPDKIKDKIFQPFFTTKPTGQGTGLGLSLSYDIVKAHGGKLQIETKVGQGSTFIILLPKTISNG